MDYGFLRNEWYPLPLSDAVLSSVKLVNSIGLEDTQDNWRKCTQVHSEFCIESRFLSISFFFNQKKLFFKKNSAYECK